MSNGDEIIRRLTEQALQAGRKRLSQQTGYIHHAYHVSEDEPHYPIPIVENVLYVLALFASKSSENMLEARSRMERLLCFQNLADPFQKGNFPVYLHDYPFCSDAFIGVHLLSPFYWILKSYGTILGNDLKERLERACLLLMEHSLKVLEQKKITDALGMKIAAAAHAFGTLFQQTELCLKGEQTLAFYHRRPYSLSWFSPSLLAEMCLALQMVYPNLSDSPWRNFWEHLAKTWHLPTCSYSGPGVKELQEGNESQPTLYDFYLGYFSKKFSLRSQKDHVFHLYGVLIQSSADTFPEPNLPLVEQGSNEWLKWLTEEKSLYAASFVQKNEALPFIEKEFHPFKVIWGKESEHSFVCQGGTAQRIECSKTANGFELAFHFDSAFVAEEREKTKEIAFYLDYDDKARLTVDSSPATTFQLGQKVEWSLDSLQFSLTASVAKGEGNFFGHIMRGNRPSQLSLKGSQRFNSYDWIVFLRTLSRSDQCQINITITLQE